jgi:hypothetical protein
MAADRSTRGSTGDSSASSSGGPSGGRIDFVTSFSVEQAGDRLRAALELQARDDAGGTADRTSVFGAVGVDRFDLRIPRAEGRPAVLSGTFSTVAGGTAVHAVPDRPASAAPPPDLRSRGFQILIAVLLVSGVLVALLPPGTGDGLVRILSYVAAIVGGLALFVILLGAASWQVRGPGPAADSDRLERFLREALPAADPPA